MVGVAVEEADDNMKPLNETHTRKNNKIDFELVVCFELSWRDSKDRHVTWTERTMTSQSARF